MSSLIGCPSVAAVAAGFEAFFRADRLAPVATRAETAAALVVAAFFTVTFSTAAFVAGFVPRGPAIGRLLESRFGMPWPELMSSVAQADGAVPSHTPTRPSVRVITPMVEDGEATLRDRHGLPRRCESRARGVRRLPRPDLLQRTAPRTWSWQRNPSGRRGRRPGAGDDHRVGSRCRCRLVATGERWVSHHHDSLGVPGTHGLAWPARGEAHRRQGWVVVVAMDAITMLKEDHQAVERLFKRFEKAGDRTFAEKRKLADQIVEALSRHARDRGADFLSGGQGHRYRHGGRRAGEPRGAPHRQVGAVGAGRHGTGRRSASTPR